MSGVDALSSARSASITTGRASNPLAQMRESLHSCRRAMPRSSPKTRVWASRQIYDRNLQDCCG
jgi:hypothetical protein